MEGNCWNRSWSSFLQYQYTLTCFCDRTTFLFTSWENYQNNFLYSISTLNVFFLRSRSNLQARSKSTRTYATFKGQNPINVNSLYCRASTSAVYRIKTLANFQRKSRTFSKRPFSIMSKIWPWWLRSVTARLKGELVVTSGMFITYWAILLVPFTSTKKGWK